jgi:hypothetical protein
VSLGYFRGCRAVSPWSPLVYPRERAFWDISGSEGGPELQAIEGEEGRERREEKRKRKGEEKGRKKKEQPSEGTSLRHEALRVPLAESPSEAFGGLVQVDGCKRGLGRGSHQVFRILKRVGC